jgi:two-component system cell cycle sensor histidine kinase/response regulator CckA
MKQTQGVSPVEGDRDRVNESSHLPPAADSAVLSFILAGAPCSVIAVDADERVVLWNAEAERLFGWRASEVLGERSPFPISAPESGESPREISRLARSGIATRLSVSLQRIALGNANSLVVELGHDLGDRQRLERQAVQSVKLETVARLAGGIAHDFNNVLAAIMCSCELISDSLAPGDVRGADVRAIEDASARATELTRQLLAFTRQQVLRPEVVDLNHVVRSAGRMLHGIAGTAMTLMLDLAAHPIHVRADASQLEQVLVHLVANAREATPMGGRATISTGMRQLDSDPTGGEVPIRSGNYVWLSLRDTGRGIPRDLHGRIFEPFFTTKERTTGTGLGLSAVFGIVKQSGGYTFVESEPGYGSTFTIYLPHVDADVESIPAAHAERSRAAATATILLVEDESALRGLMRRIVERSGYLVIEAENGAEALERCEKHAGAIDLVVSDIVMPMMGGREMADRMRLLRPQSKLLFVSGFTDDEVMRQGIVVSGSDYLQKPFSPAALIAKIGEMLRDTAAEPQGDD